jgi:hypothetical protein
MRVALLGTLAILAFAIPASSASALDPVVNLNGEWASHDRCPVDDPDFLSISAGEAFCISANSPDGTFKLGKITTTTGESDLQFALDVGQGGGLPWQEMIEPQGGALLADPAAVPGGILGLNFQPIPMPACSNPIQCALRNLAITLINRTRQLLVSGPFAVTATVEPAGELADFDTLAPLIGGPIIKIPVKIHLQNPILGPNCYVGSDDDPIVLQPEVVGPAPIDIVSFDADGTLNPAGAFQAIVQTGTQADSTFAAPGASGCGLKLPFPPGSDVHLLDGAVNQRVGLPSPSGNNEVVLNDTTSHIAWGPVDGGAYSAAWHSAVLP